MLALATEFMQMAQVTGSFVWLLLLLLGVVNDVSTGPSWIDWLLYAPTVLAYLGILIVGIFWVRQAP
jgi:uncharacterized integral membrane protein